jgi:hypothetical protein
VTDLPLSSFFLGAALRSHRRSRTSFASTLDRTEPTDTSLLAFPTEKAVPDEDACVRYAPSPGTSSKIPPVFRTPAFFRPRKYTRGPPNPSGTAHTLPTSRSRVCHLRKAISDPPLPVLTTLSREP